jgi:kynurenine formamidase
MSEVDGAQAPALSRRWTVDRVVDLSQELGPRTPRWPGAAPVIGSVLYDFAADGFYDRDLSLPEHVGTHLDAPAHFALAGRRAHQLGAADLVREARVFDIRELCGDDADFALTADQIVALEREIGPVEPATVALFRTGWDRFLGDPDRYVGPSSGPPRFPGLAPSAGRYLVDRGVVGIGIDTLGVEPGRATDYPLHQITLPAGLWHLEGLVGLDRLPPRGVLLVVGALPLSDGSGAPARVFALLPATIIERPNGSVQSL